MKTQISKVIFGLLFVFVSLFLGYSKASADTFYLWDNVLDINIGSTYYVGQQIEISSDVYNTANPYVALPVSVSASFPTGTVSLPSGTCPPVSGMLSTDNGGSTYSIAAPSTPGNYNMRVNFTAYNPGSGSSASNQYYIPFRVISYPVVTPPSVVITASRNSINSNDSVSVKWRVYNFPGVTNCTCQYSNGSCGSGIYGDVQGQNPLKGGTNDFPLSATSTFTVRCSDSGGSALLSEYYPTCFTSDTLVTLSNGKIINIQDVKVGDILKGENTNNKVLGLHRPKLSGKLYSFNGGRYFVTEEHPFKTLNGWKSINPEKTANENIGISVSELKVGDILIKENELVEIKTIDSREVNENTELFNFLLDGDHTYYADGYLVHNKEQCIGPNGMVSCSNANFCVTSNGKTSITSGTCPLSCSGGTNYSLCGTGYGASCVGGFVKCIPAGI